MYCRMTQCYKFRRNNKINWKWGQAHKFDFCHRGRCGYAFGVYVDHIFGMARIATNKIIANMERRRVDIGASNREIKVLRGFDCVIHQAHCFRIKMKLNRKFTSVYFSFFWFIIFSCIMLIFMAISPMTYQCSNSFRIRRSNIKESFRLLLHYGWTCN